jgi:tripartite-type tricarboxylate transporter receptor subunit TctC
MSIERENAKNEQYIYRYKGGCFSEIITYRKHLINKIKNDPDMKENMKIQQFSSESVTSERFKSFIEIVKNTGYTIYKVEKL